MKNCKYYLVILLSLVLNYNIFGQKTIVLNQTLNGSTTLNYEARDEITFDLNTLYIPTSGNNLSAFINENRVVPVDIVSNPGAVLTRTQLNTTLKVGTTSGEAEVTNSGQAVYSIPIFASPGTNDFKPELAISYVSQATSGLLGYGWDISGLISVNREAASTYYNGTSKGMAFDNSDNFVLDGQMLIPTSGTNGANGTLYATEEESFLMISSQGTAGNGPQWFKVKNKDGLEIEIGNTSDSRLVDQNGTVIVWKVNKITDANGNYILFTYLNEGTELAIKKVDYTGNAGQGLAPYNSLEFFYERKDILTQYIGGKTFTNSLLLNRIKVSTEGSKTKEYLFTYQKDIYVKLLEIIENSGGQKYNSTLVEWNNEVTSPTITTLNAALPVIGSGDYNGDGKTDYIQYNSLASTNHLTLWIADGVGFTPYAIPYNVPTTPSVFPQVQSVDFDADNKDEIYVRVYSGTGSYFLCYRFLGSVIPFSNAITSYTFTNPYVNGSSYDQHEIDLIQLDFNNDGANEVAAVRTLVSFNSEFVQNVFYTGSVNFYSLLPTDVKTMNLTNDTKVDFVDFNGDRRSDVFYSDPTTTQTNIYSFYSGSGTFQTLLSMTSSLFNSYVEHFWGDFNGDGNNDLLVHKNGGSNSWFLSYANGYTFNSPITVPLLNGLITSPIKGLLNVNDYNGDGKSDLLVLNSNSSVVLYKSTGVIGQFTTAEVYSSVNNISTFNNCFFADFNSDGNCDIYTNQFNYIKVKPNEHVNFVESIANGLNLTYNFIYDVSTSVIKFYFLPFFVFRCIWLWGRSVSVSIC